MANNSLGAGWYTAADPTYQKNLAAGVYSKPEYNYYEGSQLNPEYQADPFGPGFSKNSLGDVFRKAGATDVAYNPEQGWMGLDEQGNPIQNAFVSNKPVDSWSDLAKFAAQAGLMYLGGRALGGLGGAGAGSELAAMDAVYGGATPAGGWGTGGALNFGGGAAGAGAGLSAVGAGTGAAAKLGLTAPLSAVTGGINWSQALPFLGSAALGAYGANKVASTQAAAAQYAADLQKQMFEKQVALQEPWRQAGMNALAQMGTGFTGKVDMTQDPGYAFRLSEGLKALDRNAAARGGLLSGGALKGAQRYAQDYASQEYQNAFNRELSKYNTTAALAGVGQTTAAQQAGAAGTYGTNAANLALEGANARASGYAGTVGALTNALSAYNTYQQAQDRNAVNQQYVNWLTQGGTGGSDIRLKTNIVKLGVRADGLGVYAFDYVWGGPRNIGLMAQEVMHVYPDAVAADADGFLTVDYGKV